MFMYVRAHYVCMNLYMVHVPRRFPLMRSTTQQEYLACCESHSQKATQGSHPDGINGIGSVAELFSCCMRSFG